MASDYKIILLQKRQTKREYPYRDIPARYDIVHKGTGIGIAHADDMPRSLGEARSLRRIMDSQPHESSEPVCVNCELPGSECGCEPCGRFV